MSKQTYVLKDFDEIFPCVDSQEFRQSFHTENPIMFEVKLDKLILKHNALIHELRIVTKLFNEQRYMLLACPYADCIQDCLHNPEGL